ncbi:hypothetical protein [Comamonas sp. 26]|uniref:hypothetical protein n=1 Tax=Comamonas sp. 26 TaxID=2035201 RepID=UPI000C557729|nr:hypothetical protein [Comamonas sp. 26]PIG00387.1 hypothetical protein CLU84_3365 [Comamonas sp. 26]
MTDQVIHCSQACTVTVQHEFVFPVLSLTPAEGAQIGLAVISVWAVGWAIRALIQTLRDGGKTEENSHG